MEHEGGTAGIRRGKKYMIEKKKKAAGEACDRPKRDGSSSPTLRSGKKERFVYVYLGRALITAC